MIQLDQLKNKNRLSESLTKRKNLLTVGFTFVLLLTIGVITTSLHKVNDYRSKALTPTQSPQLIINPYFDLWGLPGNLVTWQKVGNSQLTMSNTSYDSSRSGPNLLAKVTGSQPGDGIIEKGITVKPSTLYDFYTWVKVPTAVTTDDFQYVIRSENSLTSGIIYAKGNAYDNTASANWINVTASFVTRPTETSISIAFTRETNTFAALTLSVDNTTLYERVVDTSASLVTKPAKPIIIYGMEQTYDRSADANTLSGSNVFDNAYNTPSFVTKLRGLGKVAAQRVYVPSNPTVDSLVTLWTQPFRDTLENRITGGFDAISIDELGGNWNDTNPTADIIATALQKTKELYPNRLIYVWGTWQLGNGGSTCWYGAPCPTYDKLLTAINKYADVFMLENYAPESNPQLDNAKLMAQNLTDRGAVNSQITDILLKTSFGIASYQSPFDITADDTSTLDFKAFLDEQLHRIKNNPLSARTSGLAIWPYYYTSPDSMNWLNSLISHYVTSGLSTYLDSSRNSTTGYNGDGKYQSLLSALNPSFEFVNQSWVNSNKGKSKANISYITYSSIPAVQSYHGSIDNKVNHGTYLVSMNKKNSTANTLSQTISIKPATAYEINAYVIGGNQNNAAQLQVADPRGSIYLSKTATLSSLSTTNWTKIGFTFTTPVTGSQLTISLSDANATIGNQIFWDYVELTEKTSFDVFQPSIIPTSNSLRVEWYTDIPTTDQIEYGTTTSYGNLTTLNSILTIHHLVTISGLNSGIQYHLKTINSVPATSSTYKSFDFAPFTLANN